MPYHFGLSDLSDDDLFREALATAEAHAMIDRHMAAVAQEIDRRLAVSLLAAIFGA